MSLNTKQESKDELSSLLRYTKGVGMSDVYSLFWLTFIFFTSRRMTEDVWKPSWLKNVRIFLVWWETIERDLSFNDYIGLMWSLKTKAFITLGRETINKMHILKIDTDFWPHLAMSVSSFIAEQKEKAFDTWFSREEIYKEWSNNLSKRHEENRIFTIRKRAKNGN